MVGKIEFSGTGHFVFPKMGEEPKPGDHVEVVGDTLFVFSDTLTKTMDKLMTDVLTAAMAATGDSVAPSARARIAGIKERYFSEEQAVDQTVYSGLVEKERTRRILTEALARHGAKCSYGKFTDSFFVGGVVNTKQPPYQKTIDRVEEQIRSAFALPEEFLVALDRPTLITGEKFIKSIYPSGYVRRKADSKLGFIKAGEPIKVKGVKFVGGRTHLYLEGYGSGRTTFNAKSFEDAGPLAPVEKLGKLKVGDKVRRVHAFLATGLAVLPFFDKDKDYTVKSLSSSGTVVKFEEVGGQWDAYKFIKAPEEKPKEGKIDPKSLYPSGYVRVAHSFPTLRGLPYRLAYRVTEAKYEARQPLIKLEGCDSSWVDGFWPACLFEDAGLLAPYEKSCKFKAGDLVRVKPEKTVVCVPRDRTYKVNHVQEALIGESMRLDGIFGLWPSDWFFKVTEKPDWAMRPEEYRATQYSEMRQKSVEQASEIARLTKRIKNYEEIGDIKAGEIAKLNDEVIRLKRRVNGFLDNAAAYFPWLETDRVARETI